MVQIVKVAPVLVALIGFAAAKSCNNGGIYCGSALLDKGDYITKIITNLEAQNQPTDDYTIQNSLWACIEHGDITFLQRCGVGCVGGDENDDYCGEDAAAAGKRAIRGTSWNA